MDNRNGAQLFNKSKCSLPLNHLSSPFCCFLTESNVSQMGLQLIEVNLKFRPSCFQLCSVGGLQACVLLLTSQTIGIYCPTVEGCGDQASDVRGWLPAELHSQHAVNLESMGCDQKCISPSATISVPRGQTWERWACSFRPDCSNLTRALCL